MPASADAAELLKSRKTEDRVRGVSLARRLPAGARQSLLLDALGDKANYVATLAAEALGEDADETALPAMRERFDYLMADGPKRDPGCHVRAHLAFAFGRLEYAWATDALRAGLRTVQVEAVGGVPFDTAAHLRANCALALAQIQVLDALRDIALLLFDTDGSASGALLPDPTATLEARKAAAQALARLGDRSALVPLALRLTYPQDELAEVLQECMQAVVELEDPRALELLTPYLRHEDENLAAYAALMIAQTRASEALALLRETVESLSGSPLRAVLLAFLTLRSDAAFDALYALAGHAREDVRLALVETLATMREAASQDCLRGLAGEKERSSKVRQAARRALAETG